MGQDVHIDSRLVSESRHSVGVFDSEAFLVEAVAAYVMPSFEDGSMVVVALTADRHRALERELVARGLDVADAQRRENYVRLNSSTLIRDLLVGDGVDVTAFRERATRVLDAAADRGCELRICGDMGSLLWHAGQIAAVLELEVFWNTVVGPPFELMCLYESTTLGAGGNARDLAALCERHAGLSLVEMALDRCTREALEERRGLERAISSRDLIGQAKGILMVRWRVDADTAFAMLSDASSRSNRKLRDVARSVVEQQLRRN